MHARVYNPYAGRFTSVDPGRDVDPKMPQSWNLYAYVQNNPMNLVDPTGAASESAPTPEQLQRYAQLDSYWEMDLEALKEVIKNDPGAEPVYNMRMEQLTGSIESTSADLLMNITPGGRGGGGLLKILSKGEAPLLSFIAGKQARVLANKARGDAFRDKVADMFRKAPGRQVGTEKSWWTPFGWRRLDIEVRDASGRLLFAIETKLGNSRYTRMQQLKDWWLRKHANVDVSIVRSPS